MMDVMSTPELAPPGTFRAVVAVWVAALVAAVAIGLFVPVDWRMAWMAVGFGAVMILAFVVQLAIGRSKGFIDRVAASVAGALLVMGLVSAVFGLAEIVAGFEFAG